MSGSRLVGASKTRAALIEAATQLMAEEGYAAVTTRKVAAKAQANQALVYYHFGTMDELFLAVFRRGAEANLARLQRAAEAENPLRALWEITSEPRQGTLNIEFIALANHREVIRTELASYTRQFRQLQEAVFARVLDTKTRRDSDIEPTPAALSVLMAGLSRILAMDDLLGIDDGHAEVLALLDEYLTGLQGPAPTP
ncbi:TetR/AcrR family transcriptional regulator [Nocardia noduli]|uniref:TetR/AcrR family transcriptional regulator n=1 Tax=Nocardia noduli TaxID=2815722 RepID=UPI001C21D29D|nr:TetR/AcrR family transcriptional regulator [Nocardia noduli]